MFSKKTIVIVGAVILIALNVIVFSFHLLLKSPLVNAAPRAALFFISPIQNIIHSTFNFSENLWTHYFNLISVAKQNDELRKKLEISVQQNSYCKELEISNERLRGYLGLKDQTPFHLIAAEVIAKDPSPWYQTVTINRGESSGVVEDCPVIISQGIVGHVLTSSPESAKVLLIIDRNSSVDALVQRTRARGIVEGLNNNICKFNYVLRQLDIEVGDTIVSSGYDGIYPKGLSDWSCFKNI